MREFSLLIILVTSISYGQKGKKLFDKGLEQYENDKIESIKHFKELINNYPKSDLYPISIYNIAQIYSELDSTEQAIYWFEFALMVKFKDNIEWYNFPDTHSNIRHKSAHDLGHIYYNKKEYNKALTYYLKALNNYPYYSSSGTSTKKNNVLVKRWISDCYINLNDTNKAIYILLPEAVTQTPWSSNPTVKIILDILDDNNITDSFKEQFNTALNQLEKIKSNYILKINDQEILIVPYGFGAAEYSAVEYAALIKERQFYTELYNNP